MPSSRSSIDQRDIYYRLGKSAGYRARSAYKLLHLDEEFDLFKGVKTAVDLCAAPGSWSQVLSQRLKSDTKTDDSRIVAVDLQPMAPLPNVQIFQRDITSLETVPLILNALGDRKADLVVCDGAPDVTGVHDLDAYLHSQLLLAALTLALVLLAPGGTLVFKIFLSPLDPQAAMLSSQFQPFFPGTQAGSLFQEFDEEKPGSSSLRGIAESGVYVRKPRSSRAGSGEAFLVCRNFDPSTVPFSSNSSADTIKMIAQAKTTSLSLTSLGSMGTGSGDRGAWQRLKAYVETGDLDGETATSAEENQPNGNRETRNGRLDGLRIIAGDSDMTEQMIDIGDLPSGLPLGRHGSLNRRSSLKDRDRSLDSTSPVSPFLFPSDRNWDRRPTPLPSPRLQHSQHEFIPRETPSPAPSVSSKTDLFFSHEDALPRPPKALPTLDHTVPMQARDRTRSLPLRGDPARLHKKTSSVGNNHDNSVFDSRRIVSSPSSSPVKGGRSDFKHLDETLSTLPTHPTISSNLHGLRREKRESLAEKVVAKEGDVLVDGQRNWRLKKQLGEGAFSSVWLAEGGSSPGKTSINAIKMTSRASCLSDARTRVAFQREVSVLRHISHPNIVSFISSFSNDQHHCLVLERLDGGELYEAITDEKKRPRMVCPTSEDPSGEAFSRRVFSELVKGISWLHEVGVVHRDIKLENILFTCDPFSSSPDHIQPISIDQLPYPLIKVTDFGLSRFIDKAEPLLQTRCGSESFAAPEIIMGRPYDGRQTDIWSCGVVLYALICGILPFGDEDSGKDDRKRRMMQIAKAQYSWPSDQVGSKGVRDLVGKLLTRDPKKRIKSSEIKDEGWMKGSGQIDFELQRNGVQENRSGRRRILDGFLLEEEISEDARAEM